MSLTSGFFNSVNGDRLYDAEQMSAIFDGLINDGIYDTVGNGFQTTPASGMTVNVGTGRAWLNHTWVNNDTNYPLTLSAASASLSRIDTIAIKVDHSTAVRACSIVVVEGTPAASAVAPTLPADDTTNGIYYHALADVSVAAGVTAITAAMITNRVGLSTGTPYVTGIISATTLDQLWAQLEGEFMDWWENTIIPVLNPTVVTQLQNNIDHITVKEATMNEFGFSHQDPPPSGKTYQAYSTDAIAHKIYGDLQNKLEDGFQNQYSVWNDVNYTGGIVSAVTSGSASMSTGYIFTLPITVYYGTGITIQSINRTTGETVIALTGTIGSFTISSQTYEATAIPAAAYGKYILQSLDRTHTLNNVNGSQICAVKVMSDGTTTYTASISSSVQKARIDIGHGILQYTYITTTIGRKTLSKVAPSGIGTYIDNAGALDNGVLKFGVIEYTGAGSTAHTVTFPVVPLMFWFMPMSGNTDAYTTVGNNTHQFNQIWGGIAFPILFKQGSMAMIPGVSNSYYVVSMAGRSCTITDGNYTIAADASGVKYRVIYIA